MSAKKLTKKHISSVLLLINMEGFVNILSVIRCLTFPSENSVWRILKLTCNIRSA